MTNVRRRLFAIAIVAVVVAAVGTFSQARHASATGAPSPDIVPPGAASAPCANNGVAAGTRQALHHAGLVIVFPEGRMETRCIAFSEDQISGLELLRQSGLPLVTSGFGGLGGAVCRIDNVGCSDPGNCWCQCQGASCSFWTYYTLQDGAWRFQNIGPAQREVRDGDVDAWVWGSGHTTPQGARPPCPTPTPAAAIATQPLAPAATAERPNAPQAIATGTRSAPPRTPIEPTTGTPAAQLAALATGPAEGSPQHTTAVSDAGPPMGLIAFGAVAGALAIVGGGGVALRRRSRG